MTSKSITVNSRQRKYGQEGGRSERQGDAARLGLFAHSKIVAAWECIRGRGSMAGTGAEFLLEFWRTEVEEFETNASGRSSRGAYLSQAPRWLFGIHVESARPCRQNLTHGQLNADVERVVDDVGTRVPSLGFCTSNDSETLCRPRRV